MRDVLNDPQVRRLIEVANERRRLNAVGVSYTGLNDDTRRRLVEQIEATNSVVGASLYQAAQEANRALLKFSISISADFAEITKNIARNNVLDDFAKINQNIQPAFWQEVIESHLKTISK